MGFNNIKKQIKNASNDNNKMYNYLDKLKKFIYTGIISTITVLHYNISNADNINIKAVGDIMLSRGVNKKIEQYNNCNWPFEKIQDVLKQSDITIANLESPFTIEKDYTVPKGTMVFKANPCVAKYIKQANIGLVSVANNHFCDKGKKGVADTFKVLNDNEILFVGGNIDSSKVYDSKVIKLKNTNVAFLAFTYGNNTHCQYNATMDIKKATNEIKKIRNNTDIIIVTIHAGTEYTYKPNKEQIDFSRALINAGADIVIGHHPHWVQQVEIYKNKPILYSLGNFIFDQMWSKATTQGAIADIHIKDKKISFIKIIPIRIYEYGQPMIIADNKEKEYILNKMGLSNDIIKITN